MDAAVEADVVVVAAVMEVAAHLMADAVDTEAAVVVVATVHQEEAVIVVGTVAVEEAQVAPRIARTSTTS